MPGRVIQDVDIPDHLLVPFGAEIDDAVRKAWKPRYNVSPGQTIALLRREDGTVRATWMKWGISPAWMRARGSKEIVKFARCEGIATKPSFKDAFRKRRCIFPITGWYEWPAPKEVHCVRPVAPGPLALAAIYVVGGEDMFVVLTCEPNNFVKPLHHRMGVFLERANWAPWLDPATTPEAIDAMLGQCPDDWFTGYRVSARASRLRNDDARCVEPLSERAIKRKPRPKPYGGRLGNLR